MHVSQTRLRANYDPIKKVYVMMVKEVVESEVSNREDD